MTEIDALPAPSAEGRRLMPMDELRICCRIRMLERSPTTNSNPEALAELMALRAALAAQEKPHA